MQLSKLHRVSNLPPVRSLWTRTGSPRPVAPGRHATIQASRGRSTAMANPLLRDRRPPSSLQPACQAVRGICHCFRALASKCLPAVSCVCPFKLSRFMAVSPTNVIFRLTFPCCPQSPPTAGWNQALSGLWARKVQYFLPGHQNPCCMSAKIPGPTPCKPRPRIRTLSLSCPVDPPQPTREGVQGLASVSLNLLSPANSSSFTAPESRGPDMMEGESFDPVHSTLRLVAKRSRRQTSHQPLCHGPASYLPTK